MILHSAIHQTQEPPCRLRASALVTDANHLAVTGLLSRQAISGEIMSKIKAGTSAQKFPSLIPFHTCTSKANPPRKPRVFPTICTGRVHRQPRRIPSPKMPNKAAMGKKITKEVRTANDEPILVCLEKAGDPRKTESIGMSNNSTVNPQSKATAMPIPLGAGSSFVMLPVRLVSSVSFKAVSPNLVHTPERKES